MRRWLLGFTVLLGACSKCGGKPAVEEVDASPADASLGDAAVAATDDGPFFRAIGFDNTLARLHRLADGTIVVSHGAVIERLEPDGRRTSLFTMKMLPNWMPIGTVGGTASDLVVSDEEEDYPVTTEAKVWRITDGVEKRLMTQNEFPLVTMPWTDGRVLGMQVKGAIHWQFNSFPWGFDRFVVVRGAPAPMPAVPDHVFVEDMVAFPTGEVFAGVMKWGEDGPAFRHGALAMRWAPGATAGTLDPLLEEPAVLTQHIAARSPTDVWIGGARPAPTTDPPKKAWFAHWDGAKWTAEDAPFVGYVGSMTMTDDGALWVVADRYLYASKDNVVFRRNASGWKEISAPTVRGKMPVPRIAYDANLAQVEVGREASLSVSVQPQTIVARGNDVWLTANVHDSRLTGLFHLEAKRPTGDEPLADLSGEDSRALSDATNPVKEGCRAIFVSAGEPTPETLHRIVAAASFPVVIARADGQRVVGSFLGDLREGADELATTWRKLGLPATLRCGQPPLESLVFDPDAKDD